MIGSGGGLFRCQGDWLAQIGDQSARIPLELGPSDLAARLAELSAAARINKPKWVVAPGSSESFFACFEIDERLDLRDRAVLRFELEDHLPIDAEAMVADFAVAASDDGRQRISAVAIETGIWKPRIEAIEARGQGVASVVPRAVLAAYAIRADEGNLDTSTRLHLLLCEQGRVDALTLVGPVIADWKHLACDPDALKRHRLMNDLADCRTIVAGLDTQQDSWLQSLFADVQFVDSDYDTLASRGADLILSKRVNSGFELRREALASGDRFGAVRRELGVAAICLIALLIAIAAAGWWRSERIEHRIEQIRAEQARLFRETFPEVRVPAAVVRRVRSEHAKILGSRGQATNIEIPVPATEVLRDLLAALPTDLRLRITSINILDGKVDLDIQVRSPVDAGVVAKSLAAAGFQVEPPGTTQQDGRTFQSQIEAVWTGFGDEADQSQSLSIRVAVDKERAG